MLDSNGCGSMSEESLANNHSQKAAGFGTDQIEWYTSQVKAVREQFPDVGITFAFHIQTAAFTDAYAKYGFDNTADTLPINIDSYTGKSDTDFGYLGRVLKSPWDSDKTIHNGMKELGVDSILVGHEHCNSASVVYDGIRYQFGQKSSEYDRLNYVAADGTITGGYLTSTNNIIPLVGGTVMSVSKDNGKIVDASIYYCNGYVPGTTEELIKEYNELTLESAISIKTAIINGECVYEFTADSRRNVIKINPEHTEDKSTFTFSVYLPDTSTGALYNPTAEFAIRIKPDAFDPKSADKAGYVGYSTSETDEKYKLVPNTWKTYTMDISEFGDACQDLSFVIATGNTIYLKDISFE